MPDALGDTGEREPLDAPARATQLPHQDRVPARGEISISPRARLRAERALDELFRRGRVSEAELADAIGQVAVLQGAYRLSHLETHRRLRALLTDEQVARYDRLRGY